MALRRLAEHPSTPSAEAELAREKLRALTTKHAPLPAQPSLTAPANVYVRGSWNTTVAVDVDGGIINLMWSFG